MENTRRLILCCLILMGSITLNGCSTHLAFTYPLEPIRVVESSPPAVKIAVLPANDMRGHKNKSATLYLYLIPLMPYGWVTHERPEAASMFLTIRRFEADMVEDISKAVAQHFQKAGFARTVFFDYGGLVDQSDYSLEIDLIDTRYRGTTYTYGLSVYGPLLWVFGLPAGRSRIQLGLDLRLKDPRGVVVSEHRIRAEWKFVQGLYYGWGRDMEVLARALQQGLDEALMSGGLRIPAGRN